MAELGEAVLKLTVDDSELTTRLGELRREIESLGSAGTRSTSRSSTRSANRSNGAGGGVSAPGDADRLAQLARELNLNTNWGKALRVLGEVDADLALIGASQQFNLNAGWTSALQQLQGISNDLALISAGDQINLNTSWGTALQQLREIDADLKLVGAGEALNLNTSWTSALQQLKEIEGDLKLVSAGEALNLNTSWTSALQQLKEIDADLKLVSAAEALNINSSWTAALSQLREIDADLRLVAAGESLNLNSSWTVALEQLREVEADLRAISAGDALNLRTSWTTALAQLQEIDNDLRLIQGGRDLNIATSWQTFLGQLEEVKADLDAAARQRVNAQTKETVRGRIADNRNNPSGFGAASRDNFGITPQTKSDQLEADLARVRAARLADEKARAANSKRLKALEEAEAKAIRESIASRNKRLQEAAGNAIIGGAFPALFGQGAGASVGGGLGGAAGGLIGGNFGFGLSLVGTAVGQQVDIALQKLTELGAALDSPVKSFSALQQSALLSSRSLEKNAESLIASGRYAEANALIQADLIATYGDLSGAQGYRDEVDKLNRAWAQGQAALASFIAGPLEELIKRTRLAIGGTPQNNNERELQQQQRRNVADTFTKAGLFVGSIGGAAALTPGAQLPGLATLGIGGLLTGIGRLAGQGGPNPADEDLKPLVEAANRAVEARKKSLDLAKAERAQIVAQAQGNRDAADAAERLAAAGKRDQQIAADPTQAQAAWLEYEKTIVGVNERQKQREKELTATIAQEVIKRQQIAQQIGVARARRDAALAAGDSAANPGNTTLAARAGELEGLSFLSQNRLRVEQAITSERILQAQYAQESDPTKRAQLAEQITSASYELRLAGEEAGAALAEKAASAAQSLRSAQETLRGTLQSNFKFLPRDQRQSLLDSARADIERGRQSGILRPNFGAAGRRRTFEAADFVRNVEQQRGQVAQQQALVDALKENTNAERNIRINVTMNADGSFNVNQTEQQAALL